MKNALFIALVLLLIAAVPFSALSEPKKVGNQSTRYVVANPNHTQLLGGKSEHAGNGLQVAAAHSGAVTVVPGDDKGDSGEVIIITPGKK
jgi:hypothetical protein